MKTRNKIILSFALMLFAFAGYSQGYHVRFGFFGNSITIGAGLTNPEVNCYPGQIALMLQKKYGDTCIVKNFAISGRTMLKKGDFPIWVEPPFKNGLNYAPDIVFICLGTNDTKPQNWDVHKADFIPDYLSMIDTFKARNPNTKFIVCYPPPAYAVVTGIRNTIIENGIIPGVDSVIKKRDVSLVDFHTSLLDSVKFFSDKIHPNAAGSKVMAKIAFDRIVEEDLVHKVDTGYPFVISLNSNSTALRIKDTATITWTTINTNKVSLNGQQVELNGSIKVAPLTTTDYTFIAEGVRGNDTLVLKQVVYKPAVSSVYIDPYNAVLKEGENIHLHLIYYDQASKLIEDTLIDATWAITEGSGNLTNLTDTSATFVAINKGTTKIKATVNGKSYTATMTIEAGSGNKQISSNEQPGYPSPCDKEFNLPIEANGAVIVRIYDMGGSLKLQKLENYSSSGNHILSINVEELKSGVYIYNVENSGKLYTGKINKR